jgi:TPR repeat protein
MLSNQTQELSTLDSLSSRLSISQEDLLDYFKALGIEIDMTSSINEDFVALPEDYVRKKKNLLESVSFETLTENNEIEKNLLEQGDQCYSNGSLIEAFNYFYLAYTAGSMQACYMLGRVLERESIFGPNYKKALEYYTIAAENEIGEAEHRLAECYRDGIGCEKDYLQAIKYFKYALKRGFNSPSDYENIDLCVQNMYKQQAESGNAQGYFRLANYLVKKKGLGYDDERVKEYLTLGAEMGDASSLYRMGIYAEEDGNRTEAREYLIQAAKNGNLPSMLKLENDYDINVMDLIKDSPMALLAMGEHLNKKGDIDQSLQYYMKAAELGDSEGEYRVGTILQKYPSFETDLSKNHIYWLKLSSQKGNANANYRLGICYEGNDTIIEQDKKKAFECFEKAANDGQVLAMSKLGFYYKRGVAVNKNFEKSYEWYLKAAEGGHSIAQNQLAFCYMKGEGCEKDWSKAFYWFEKASEQKHYVSLYQLGLCYMYARGCEKDLQKAKECFEQALDNGYDAAQKQLDVLNKLDRLNGNSNIENLKTNVNHEVTSFNIQQDMERLNRPENTEKETIKNSNVENCSVQNIDVESLTEKECIELMFKLQDKIQADVLNDVIAQQRLEEIEKEDKVRKAKDLIAAKGFTAEQLELLKDYFNKE